jgi:DNA-binding MarR family transcriptional regulator
MTASGNPADHLSQLMLEFYEKMASWEHSVVKQTGLSPAQMHTIEMIGHHPNLRMKELASRMGITTGTLTVMIDRLAKGGLVARRPHARDRRSFNIALTEKGRQHFKAHHALHLELTREITAALTDAEIEQLERSLTNMMERF